VQFVIVFLHAAQLLVYECNYPKTIVALLLSNALYFVYLFAMFYRRAYSSKKDV
jgi:elongation of very long chain fatty acids protein 7